MTGIALGRADVDHGYRGHKPDRDGLDVIISNTRGITSLTAKGEMRRRNAIKPVNGHMRDNGHLERNHLKGPEGDAINAVLTAASHNLRLLEKWLMLLFIVLSAAFLQIHIRQSICTRKHTPT